MEKKKAIWKSLLPVMALLVLLSIYSCSTSKMGPDDEAPPLTFSTPNTVKPTIHGGMAEIVITASGGVLPYEFYVIPETQWLAGDMMHDMLSHNDFSRLYRYTYSRKLFGSHSCIIEVSPGSSTAPKYCWVAVQDKAENGVISGTNMLSWWKRVAVSDL
jgi:hypothetical protein